MRLKHRLLIMARFVVWMPAYISLAVATIGMGLVIGVWREAWARLWR